MLNKYSLVVAVVLIVDQILKVWIKTNLILGQEIHFFDWFIIHFTENRGMAFGFEFGGKYGKYFLSIFRTIAIIGISFRMLYRLTFLSFQISGKAIPCFNM